MKTDASSKLSCSVFGHNLYRPNPREHKQTELVCSTCNTTIATDSHGDFNEELFTNKDIQTVLRELFVLKTKMSRFQLFS